MIEIKRREEAWQTLFVRLNAELVHPVIKIIYLILNFFLILDILEVVSKPQIRLESKASIPIKSGAYTKCVSILIRIATRLSSLRWGFETTSRHFQG